jgi:hypothetical protein
MINNGHFVEQFAHYATMEEARAVQGCQFALTYGQWDSPLIFCEHHAHAAPRRTPSCFLCFGSNGIRMTLRYLLEIGLSIRKQRWYCSSWSLRLFIKRWQTLVSHR